MSDDADQPGDRVPEEPDTARPSLLGPGACVAHYEILETLGTGGMGVLYRARDTALDREVALKSPWRHVADNPTSLARFAREARAAARLSHPNIVQVYDVVEHDGLPWIAMQIVRGRNLKAVLAERGALPIPEVLWLAEQLASALEHAHSKGILHRDIKPANVLIGEEGRALLADFGLARLLPPRSGPPIGSTVSASLTGSSAVVGTPMYMSPEQALGRSLDERSDIFSLGAVLYEMCTGRPLVAPGSFPDVVGALVDLELPSLRASNPRVPAGLERIVQRAVAWRPEARYPSAGALGDDLRRFRQSTESSSGKRYKAALAVSLLLLVVAVALGLAGRFRWLAPERQTDNIVATPLVTWPSIEWEPRISPDKRWVSFLSNRDGQDRIWLRSLSGSLEQPVSPPSAQVESHAWSQDGTEIAFIVRGKSGRVLQTMPAFGGTTSRSVALATKFVHNRFIRWIGSRVYIESGSRSLFWIDLDTGDVAEPQGSPGDSAQRFDFDVRLDDTRIVYAVASDERCALWTSDIDGGRPERITSGEFCDMSPRWRGGQGAAVVYTSNRSGQLDLWGIDPRDRSTARLTLSAGVETASDSSSDGRLLVFEQTSEESHLWIRRLATAQGTQLTADSLSDFGLSVAGDRSVVAFQRATPRVDETANRLFGSQVVVGRLVGDQVVETRTVSALADQVYLSPDGRWLAYARRKALWILDLTTDHGLQATATFSAPGTTLFPLATTENNVSWRPNATELYYVEANDSGSRIRRLDPTSGQTDSAGVVSFGSGSRIQDLCPSNDGDRLAYVVARETGSELRCRHLPSGEDRAILSQDTTMRPKGWLDARSLIVTTSSLNPDITQTLNLFEVDISGHTRPIGEIEGAFGHTAVVDPATRRLFSTASEGDVHNIVALDLDTGAVRALTANTLPGVSFSAVQVLPDGAWVYVQQQRGADIWAIEFRRTE